jgi:two-component system response regulator VanR
MPEGSSRTGPPGQPDRACVDRQPVRYAVRLKNRRVSLTPKEFEVLDILLKARGGIVRIEEILRQVWDEGEVALAGKVRIVVARLRKRLGDSNLIETIGGEGYRLATPEEVERI